MALVLNICSFLLSLLTYSKENKTVLGSNLKNGFFAIFTGFDILESKNQIFIGLFVLDIILKQVIGERPNWVFWIDII